MKSVHSYFDIAQGQEYTTTTIYTTTNEIFEKWIKKVGDIYLKVLIPTGVLLCLISSYFNYFVLNLSEESFTLVFPFS